ncbi:MAG: hypothetical protein D6800_00165 [Candidatus Zixiibacteriota bacterium]|nr:MAG: hypothetical protein D6800_00165 [candidate division Zixibacteria bacterium]
MREFLPYLKRALSFSWPIMLNVLLFLLINNYGKIYARNFLSEEDMFNLSFVQRLAIIIQLAHASAMAYLSKRVYLDKQRGVSLRITALYSALIVAGVLMVAAAFVLLRLFSHLTSVPLNAVSLLLVIYTVLWCYVGYLEMYLARINRNKYVLICSAAAAVVFVAVLFMPFGTPLYRIALAMTLSMAGNLALVMKLLRHAEERT